VVELEFQEKFKRVC